MRWAKRDGAHSGRPHHEHCYCPVDPIPETVFERVHQDILTAGGPLGPNDCQDCCEAIMDILRECSERPDWNVPMLDKSKDAAS